MKALLCIIFCFGLLFGVTQDAKGEECMQRNNIYFVILAGGSGERLWPLSRQAKPKQLLSVGSEQTLLEQAVARVTSLVQSKEQIWIVTTKDYEQEIRSHIGSDVGTILVEPAARNTAPAILLCCLELYKVDPDATVVFLPADAFIPSYENEKFGRYLAKAINFVSHHEVIGLLGVKPTWPATGYGYIEFDSKHSDQATGLHKVSHFHEKPSSKIAQQYIQKSNMLWNIGMFCSQVSVFIDEFKQAAPSIFDSVHAFVCGTGSYTSIQSEPVDRAVIERSKRVWVLPVDFSWCDVGNIGVFLSLKEQFGTLKKNLISIDADHNLVDVQDKLVVLVGVHDLCIVQTEDVLLITRNDQAERVREVVNQLKESNYSIYL